MGEWTDAQELVAELTVRLDQFDWPGVADRVEALSDRVRMTDELLPAELASEILQALRRKRRFTEMARLAAALIASGRVEATIRRQQAQAFIDRLDDDERGLDEAERILGAMLFDSATPRREIAEAHGLLGRIHKQRYVNAADPTDAAQQHNLRQAIFHYDTIYSKDARKVWHGINVVACLARAKRDRVDVTSVERKAVAELASDILVQLDAVKAESENGVLGYWDRATSMEAHLALGDIGKAIDEVRAYVRDPRTDAFECFSTLRQIREVWQVDRENGDGGAAIVGALTTALLKRSGGEIELQSSDVQRGLQANFSQIPDLPLQWWRTGLERCSAIARIETHDGKKRGTGFLVRRGDFFGDGSDERLLLTNWHVVSENGEHEKSIRPEAARANFQAAGCQFLVGKEIAAYNRRLDATFLRLEAFNGVDGHCPIEPMPAPFDVGGKSRVYVIGYPGGRDLSFSIHDSLWLDTDGTKLHYRTPTEPGSSGSPVFDQDGWVLLGLHHSGLKDMRRLNGKPGSYEANEGNSVAAIQTALKTSLKA